jgi:SH3 domain protein
MCLKRIGILMLALVAVATRAETMYVVDGAVVNVRAGPGTDNDVVGQVSAGEAVDLLDERVGEFGRIRTAGGDLEGWVSTRYLSPERSLADRLREARSELTASADRITELQSQVMRLEDRLRAAAAGSAGEDGASLPAAHAGSAGADGAPGIPVDAALADQNTSLRMRVNELSRQLDVAMMQTEELRNRSRQNWFLIGAAVLFGGIVIGLVAPTLRRRRRSSW